MRRPLPDDRHGWITPELTARALRAARRYVVRFGDRDGLWEPCALDGLLSAATLYDAAKDRYGFPAFAQARVVLALNDHLRRSGPPGYRHDQRLPGNRLGAPGTVRIDAALPARDDPVGWEIEYEDFLEHEVRGLGAAAQALFRLLYLHCEGRTMSQSARRLGWSRSVAWQVHARAVLRIRARRRDPE